MTTLEANARPRVHAAERSRPTNQTTGFHQQRLKATQLAEKLQTVPVNVSEATAMHELKAAAILRAQSFYVYPPERQFAGARYQQMKADEELERLQQLDDSTRCLMATCAPGSWWGEIEEIPDEFCLSGEQCLVGSLDVTLARSIPDEALISRADRAAYMLNVCTAPAARRRGVGRAMVHAAVAAAEDFGASALCVHLMAVNEIGRRLYESCGFELEQEETSNQAHYRGHCLDGIEGRGRTILMCKQL